MSGPVSETSADSSETEQVMEAPITENSNLQSAEPKKAKTKTKRRLQNLNWTYLGKSAFHRNGQGVHGENEPFHW